MKKKKKKKPASRDPILAAGGIVTRGQVRPLFAVVRLRRQKSWVLPKGKLNRNETVLAAARREAIEETGHDVEVREFLGSIAYLTSARRKIVRFWRMEASGRPVAELMKDVSAVRWLPLSRAISKLTHDREKEFLAKVGPRALLSLRRKRNARHAPLRKSPQSARRAAAPATRKRAKAPSPIHKLGNQAQTKAEVPRALEIAVTHQTSPKQFVQTLWRWLGR